MSHRLFHTQDLGGILSGLTLYRLPFDPPIVRIQNPDSIKKEEVCPRVFRTFRLGKKTKTWGGNAVKKMPHTANNRPPRTCVIKEYQYYTIILSKYQKKVKEGQERPILSKMVNTVKTRKKRSKKAKNGHKL